MQARTQKNDMFLAFFVVCGFRGLQVVGLEV